MEQVNCIFCNHSTAQQAICENDFIGNQCADCKLIYVSPRPTIDEVIDIYGHDQAQISAETHIKGSYLKRLYAQHTLSLILKHIKKGTLLEIGSGGGYFLDEARQLGFEPYGIELNSTQADFIQNNLKIECEKKPLSDSSFGEQKFDLIYHCDVISHFHDPIKEFKNMITKLKPGGFVIFETGNIGEISKKYYPLFPAFQYPDHLFFFTHDNLITLLEQTGFVHKKTYHYSIVANLMVQEWLKKIFGSKKSASYSKKIEKNGEQNYSPSWTKKLYYHLLFTLRYKIGSIIPKYKRPQTMIVIAQKRV